MIAVLAGIAIIAYRYLRRQAPHRPASARPSSTGSDAPSGEASAAGEPPPYSTDAIETVLDDCYKVAFGVARFDYQIMGDHAAVLERVGAGADESVHRREYFPRRPMLLPKLLQTLNDTESTRRELVRLLLEDPSLAGSVLQRANSAFYRLSPEPVDTLDRAVLMLGTEGLRGLMATAILLPVFRMPKGYFDNFAAVTWEQAQRCAVAAETYAKATKSCDPLIAQLLGLLDALARIVLFRLTMDTYREWPDILPRAEVFIRSIQAHGSRVAGRIAATWELSDPSIAALQEQTGRLSPAAMTPLGRAVYFGNLCGALAMLKMRNAYSVDGAQAILVQQGADQKTVYAMWHAATSVGSEA